MSDFNRAITFGLRNASTYFFRGMMHFRNRDYRAADADFETAVGLNPSQAPSLAMRTALSIRARNPYNTIVAADRALTLRPDNVMALNVKAYALARRAEANELLSRTNAFDGRAHQRARALVLELAR